MLSWIIKILFFIFMMKPNFLTVFLPKVVQLYVSTEEMLVLFWEGIEIQAVWHPPFRHQDEPGQSNHNHGDKTNESKEGKKQWAKS